MMKMLLIIVVAFVFIVGASEANGETVTLVNRRLLSDANLGRKDNVGVKNDQKVSLINGNKGALESGESKTSTEGNQNENTDGFFDDPPSGTENRNTHRYCIKEDPCPRG
ncbi:hypothetical protein RHGRI_012752 [Rhododendron griersonianum]|uniref:Uncharacterized protein n=1 Tax=Rhododendron griersonianum TaxID=479676 RepID=A0AAV6KST2_9ERIC|nr:hypothetical protein RHGRI_012752 [Rhododendron griersonianum]